MTPNIICEDALRFDIYVVSPLIEGDHMVTKWCSDLSFLSAHMVAGVTGFDLMESIVNEGWCGTCPEWSEFQPVVTVPHGAGLKLDQLNFMFEEAKRD